MNVRIFWVCAMKCMCAETRPRFILSSERVFGGMEFEPMLTPREKSPLSPEEDRTYCYLFVIIYIFYHVPLVSSADAGSLCCPRFLYPCLVLSSFLVCYHHRHHCHHLHLTVVINDTSLSSSSWLPSLSSSFFWFCWNISQWPSAEVFLSKLLFHTTELIWLTYAWYQCQVFVCLLLA